jgi:glycosyltransferase involved in cell wall biosynthesis
MEMMDATVTICTYNGADVLPEVLDCLRVQEAVDDLEWEVIVVDNNSTDNTRAVVEEHQETWDRRAPLRYVFEERQGKSNALQTAVEEAQGTWVALLDDDNFPAPDWVAALVRFGTEHPNAGAFGGRVHGQFEENLPESFGLVKPLLAPDKGTEKICYSDGDHMRYAASGSGLVVRRDAWMESIPDTGLDLKGPSGSGRSEAGVDFEVQWRLYQHGWEIWHNPDMHLDHMIPAARLEEEYLRDFFKDSGLGRYRVRMLRFESWQRPLATVAYWGADLWKLVRLAWTYRSKVLTDRFVRGRVRMVLHTFVAPFRSN